MTKDYGKSIHDRLLNISRKEQLSFQMILSRYIQERFLYRVSVSEYSSKFLLKGGALLYVFDLFAARPTLDIDLLGIGVKNSLPNMNLFYYLCNSNPTLILCILLIHKPLRA